MATFLKPHTTHSAAAEDTEFDSRALSDAKYWVEYITGREEMSGIYEYEILLRTDMGPLERTQVEDLLRQPAQLLSAAYTERESVVHGIVRSAEMVSHADVREGVRYRVVLVPRLWLATQTVRSRLFHDMTVPAIVKMLLEELRLTEGRDFDLFLDRRHPPREYVVQYQESDFAFLSRLLEYEGIFYWFEQTKGNEKLVLADANEAFTQSAGHERIGYDGRAGMVALEVVRSLSHRFERRPQGVAVRDYNYRTPSVVLYGDAPVDPEGVGAVLSYGEHAKDPDDCKRVARIRAEELRSRQEVFEGRSTVRNLRPGMKFALEGFPVQDLDQEYVVIEVEHAIDQRTDGAKSTPDARAPRAALTETGALSYGNAFRAIPYRTQWRPARITPRPKITGLMHARIDGEYRGMAAPLDEHGRYQVWLPFDTGAKTTGHARRWIRMAQAHAGPGYGMHLPLSVGTEVLLEHLDGDPDRPIIVGSVPNPETGSPVTRHNNVEGVIRTRSGITIRMINSVQALPDELRQRDGATDDEQSHGADKR